MVMRKGALQALAKSEGKHHERNNPMRFKLICVGAVSLMAVGFVMGQGLKTSDLNLRGNRFAPLTYDQMTPQQKTMIDHILSGPRGSRTSLDGPFNVYL